MAMQLLFQEDAVEQEPSVILGLFWKCHSASSEARKYSEVLFKAALERQEEIDELIGRFAHKWKLERMSPVDRNVLRMAIAEYLTTDTPKAVLINEAIEIARKFGSEKSPEFVNGILDAVTENVERSSS